MQDDQMQNYQMSTSTPSTVSNSEDLWPDIAPAPTPLLRHDLTEQYEAPVYQPVHLPMNQPLSPVYQHSASPMHHLGNTANFPHSIEPVLPQPRTPEYPPIPQPISQPQPQSQYFHEAPHPTGHMMQPTVKEAKSYVAGKETFEERLKEELKIEDIKVELSRENYKKKFNCLTCWEEMSHIEILTNK